MNNKREESKGSPSASKASVGAGYPGQSQLAIKEQGEQPNGANNRVCAGCELNLRLREWDQQTAVFKEANPDYATAQGVRRDQKIANKGPLWNAQALHIAQAKKELQQGVGPEGGLSRQKKKKAILERATLLSQALLSAITSGNLISAFRAAGKRMEEDDQVGQEYIKTFEAAMADKDDERQQIRLDNLEPEIAQTMDYQTCNEYGDKQSAMLKALDFVDAHGEGLRMYNVCRAKTRWDPTTGTHCSCGLAFPAKMWEQPDLHRWRFACRVNWSALLQAQAQAPEDPILKGWVDDMYKEYGDEENWPKIGCGATFVPWKKGMSMVAEVKCADGRWEAFVADRLPTQLDDEIKRVHAAFFLAGKKLNEEELLKIIPISFPMTNHLKGFKSIAKYPVDEWEKRNYPCFTTKSWCKLAMMIASKDLTNLHKCFDIAKKIDDQTPEA